MTYHRSTYEGSGDPKRRRTDYRPWWLDNLADDATGEGAFMQGAARGSDAIRSLVTFARTSSPPDGDCRRGFPALACRRRGNRPRCVRRLGRNEPVSPCPGRRTFWCPSLREGGPG